MTPIVVRGWGAVSPAGWGIEPLRRALGEGQPVPAQPLLDTAGGQPAHQARIVPAPVPRPPVLAHPRLRRASAISQYAVAAAQEALLHAGWRTDPGSRLGVVTGSHAACIRYSEKFFGEALRDPATASPLLFPETVVNAPASHLAACLGNTGLTYSLIGDQTAFVQALMVATDWLLAERVDACLVVGAEEVAWSVADALGRFGRGAVPSEGAGALVLTRGPVGADAAVRLERITDAQLYAGQATRKAAAQAMRNELPPTDSHELLVTSGCGVHRMDGAETAAWSDWTGPRLAPRVVFGEGFSAATAWQCVAACAALADGTAAAANVSVVGSNLQAIGVRFALVRNPVPS